MATTAQESDRQNLNAEPPLENWRKKLSANEKQEFLLKLVWREPHVDLQLIHRFKELTGAAQFRSQSNAGYRRLSELQEIAEVLAKQQHQQEQNATRKKRIKELEALATREAQIWKRVVELIEVKQTKPYDEAPALLNDLRDLAEHQGRLSEFIQRFKKLQ